MDQETSSDDELVGKIASGYRVLARVGSGTMGHVYDAEDTKRGGRVALKLLHRHHRKEFAARFLREGKTLALLSHPNIVKLVEMGQLEDGELFLATELVDGKSLREVMDQGPMSPQRALSIIRQLLDALDAAHALGVVHRDIKPENVMIESHGDNTDVVKVLDFGVAKLLADTVAGLGEANLTSVGFSVFGSALYIAPEAVTGQKIDARLDLYSAGSMLYEMLAGRPPFDHEDPGTLLRMHAFDPAPTLEQGAPMRAFTPDTESLVARALAKLPDQRFRHAADMITAVDVALASVRPPSSAALERAPSRATGSSPVTASTRRASTQVVRFTQRRTLVLAGAAVALVVTFVLLWTASSRDGAAQPTHKAPPAAVQDDFAARARQLIVAGDNQRAVDVIEHELAARSKHISGRSYLLLGHARLALGRRLEALAAYELALRHERELDADAELRANLLKIVDVKDSLVVVLALEMLSSLSPPAHDEIVDYGSRGKLVDGRRRAAMIAERDGVAARLDRVESWTLDLRQATTCEQRKAAIDRLAEAMDRRALPALKRARAVKCVERAAAEAILRIDAPN